MLGIGGIIKANRKEMKISQAELCYGICAQNNLSFIENGKRDPSRATFEALMERMGLSAGVYPSFLTDMDKAAFELKYDFNEYFAKGEYDDAEKALNRLEELPGLDKVYARFVLMSRVLIEQVKGLDPKKVVKKYDKIIPMFIENFSPDKIKRILLTKAEINMLNAYAVANYEAGNVEIAVHMLYELVTYIEYKVYDKEGIAVVYTKLLYTLSKYVGMSGDDNEAVRLCEMGIQYCIRYNRYRYFSHLLYNKGYGLIQLNKIEEGHKCIQECYYIERALGDIRAEDIKRTMTFAKSKGIQLI